ncbi:MAG: PAS domain S-box protein, partial [Myxococcota bacterium]|nr:PAS domain S-box protein [Myxococcota bacterium]
MSQAAHLWVEIDAEGQILRCSTEVQKNLRQVFGSDMGLPGLVRNRADLRAAIARQAGHLRVGLGTGRIRTQYDLEITAGGSGIRVLLREAHDLQLGASLVSWADGARDGVVILDADGHMLWCNAALSEQVGYSQDELIGRNFSNLHSPEMDPVDIGKMWRALLGRGAWEGSVRNRRSDGTTYPARLALTAVRGEQGHSTHYTGVVVDRAVEAELELLESIDASASLVARLAAGFAHDINNIAGEMVGLSEQALDSESEQERKSALERTEQLALSVGEVGRQLLLLAGELDEAPPADLNAVGRDLAWLLVRASAQTREVRVSHEDTPMWVDGAPPAILKALLQTALRAASELPEDRRIEVAVERHGDTGSVRMTYGADSTERARLRMLFAEGAVRSALSNALRSRIAGTGVSLDLELGAQGDVSVIASVPLCESTRPEKQASP